MVVKIYPGDQQAHRDESAVKAPWATIAAAMTSSREGAVVMGDEGHDRTRTVQAVVDATGQVVDFRIAREWRRGIDSRNLGSVVLEAVRTALAAQLSARGNQVPNARELSTVRPARVSPSPVALRHVLSVLAQARKAHDGAAREPAEGHRAGGFVTVGFVTVSLVGMRIVGITTESRRNANNMEVAGELRRAFQAAYATVRSAENHARSSGALAELRSLMADPQEFVRTLFGGCPGLGRDRRDLRQCPGATGR